jgi:glycosyltransferase involved in cell wall biosynthesis
MQVIYDDEIFFRQPFGGVSKIFATLIEAAKSNTQIDLCFKNYYTENEYLLNLNLNAIPPYLKGKNFPLKGKLVRLVAGSLSHTHVNKLILKNNPAVFHPTFYSNYFFNALQKANKTKLVFTIHDLIHEKYPYNSHFKYLAKIKAENLKRAHAIITVSEHTKNDLLNIYPFVNPDIVFVNHLAESITATQPAPIANLPEHYILFVGEREGYKNFSVLLEAFSKIASSLPHLMLFCTGSSKLSALHKQQINHYGLQNRVIKQSLTVNQLKTAYSNAAVFVFPSLYEGFGIPILEAFACQTPVIASYASSLPEVAGNAALFFEPTQANDLAEKIMTLLKDETLKKQLVANGINRLRYFSWQKHIDKTFEIYKQLLS